MPTEIPQLDNIFVQAVSEDLRKKLIRHLGQEPATTIDENTQRFNDLVLLAIDAEEELRTVTNIAKRATFRQTCPYGPRGTQQYSQRAVPRTFMTTTSGSPDL
jgi:hypothetical protein